MIPGIRTGLAAAAKAMLPQGIKRWLKARVRAYYKRLRAFTPADLKRELVAVGVGPGDVVMVHSAFDSFLGFTAGPIEIIETLQQVVGAAGTLLMPTIPFQGTAVEYARDQPVFDVHRTVSRMGLITEIFRRSPGVVRSIHPTHSVAAWGSKAQEIIVDHQLADTPCGRLTPYGKLLDYDGRILLMGVSPSTMTFCYFVAEELEPRLPVPVLTAETYAMRWKDEHGTVRTSNLRLFAPGLNHDLTPLVTELKRRGHWRQRSVAGVRLVLLEARGVYDAAVALVGKGLFVQARLAG